jgi:hypothetical protein
MVIKHGNALKNMQGKIGFQQGKKLYYKKNQFWIIVMNQIIQLNVKQ